MSFVALCYQKMSFVVVAALLRVALKLLLWWKNVANYAVSKKNRLKKIEPFANADV